MGSSRGSSYSFVALFSFLLCLYNHCGEMIGKVEAVHRIFTIGSASLKPTFHACTCGIMSVHCVLTYYIWFSIFIGWSSNWFPICQNITVLFRTSGCSPSFVTLVRGAGIKAPNWDSQCLCLSFISLSADHQENKTACHEICLANNITKKYYEKQPNRRCV